MHFKSIYLLGKSLRTAVLISFFYRIKIQLAWSYIMNSIAFKQA